MNATAKILARAARRTRNELSGRTFTERHRLSETLAVALFSRQLTGLKPGWKKSLWLEARPFAPDMKKRVDIWLDWRAARSSLAIEVKVGDPAFPFANGRFATRGGLIYDVAKLASALRHAHLGHSYILYFGRADYFCGEDLLSRLAAKAAGQQTVVSLAKLPANKEERHRSRIENRPEPKLKAPKRVGMRLLARHERHGFGFWLWEVTLPK